MNIQTKENTWTLNSRKEENSGRTKGEKATTDGWVVLRAHSERGKRLVALASATEVFHRPETYLDVVGHIPIGGWQDDLAVVARDPRQFPFADVSVYAVFVE